MSTVPFTEKDVKVYLDNAIRNWRQTRDVPDLLDGDNVKEYVMACHYIDAFQSVRMSLFGELLPKEK